MFYGEGLVLGLKDVDPEVRVRAANALKELEDPRATMPARAAFRRRRLTLT